ncbi:MAG TPA: PqqD family peptide modification chaperone [Silvibacterium sp.]|nr:PqqD family peptide modification chaperone [Silvibacterium sp.]
MTDNRLIARREGWIAAWVDENLIMMHAESSFYLNLTGSGGRIWELLESPRSISNLCETLGREFEIDPEAARPEVLAFLDQLLLRKAVDVHPSVLA